MSSVITPEFVQALSYLFTQKTTTSEFYLKPLNTAVFYDTGGNVVAVTNQLSVKYSAGSLSIICDFIPETSATLASVKVGNTYNGIFTPYFTLPINNQYVEKGQLYEASISVNLNQVFLVTSPFKKAQINVSRLVEEIASILAGNPLHAGKTGQFFDAIYIINTKSNVSQSYRIPITIATTTPTLLVGGIVQQTVYGNEIALRDANQNDLILVTSNEVIRFRAGKQIVFEFTFVLPQ